MSGEGLMACPMMVYDELLGGQDDLVAWAKQRKTAGMCTYTDEVVQQEFQRVCAYAIQRYPDNQSRRRFLDRVDPWIIAHVIAKGGTVVTHEQKSPEASNKVNIPNV